MFYQPFSEAQWQLLVDSPWPLPGGARGPSAHGLSIAPAPPDPEQ